MITPPSGGYNTNNTFIQQQQQQQQKQSPTLGLVDGGGSGDGDDNKNNMNNARAAGPPSTSRPPASAASQDISRKANMLGSGSGGGVGAGRKRELASLLASSPAVHHHIGTTPLPTTMPVSGGDRPPGSEDDLTFEVTRFGRPRVAPLAYWSSERLVVGTKAAGAQGIDKGSASGDLLASAGTITKKSGVKKNAEAPVAAKRGGRSIRRGRTAAGATTTTTSTRDGSRGKAAVTIDDDDDDISLPAPGSGIASIALAAGAKASAAAAAAKKKKTMLTTTAATTAAELPEPAARPISASPLPAIINTTTTTPTSVSNNKTLPEVKGVPATTLAALAATPPAQRPRRCGECISCLNPSRKQACLTLRALGANPPLSRVSHKKKQQAAAAGASAKKVSGKKTTTTAARKRSPSPPIAAKAAALPQDSEETNTEKQPIKKKRTLNRSKRKAETSIDTGATGAGGPVRRSTRQRSASVEVTANYREPSTVMDTVTKGNASVGPPSSRNTINKIALAAGGAGGGTAGAAVVVDPASIWTAEQVAALHRGWLKVAPDAKNFWQKVAAMVPGRSANECFNKIYEKHPTPPAKKPAGGGGKKLLAAVRAGSVDTTTTEPLKVGGTSKQAVQNAARKIARQQQRLQQRAEEGAGGGSGKELLAAEPSEEQQHRDKYIDQILRKRRGRALGMAPHRAVKPSGNTAGASGAGGKGAGGGGFRAGASGVAREVTAALAAAREDEPDRDSEEESDYYWSDAE
jgi:hypothetical protein